MALTVALGLGISGVAAAGCYGLYRLLFRSVDAATDREERRETQSSIADASSSGDEVASVSENDSGEEILKDVEESNSEGTQSSENSEVVEVERFPSSSEQQSKTDKKEPLSPQVNQVSPQKLSVEQTPQASSTPKVVSPAPPVAPKVKPKPSKAFQSPANNNNISSDSGRGSFHSPNGVQVMIPGLAEKIAQRRQKEENVEVGENASSEESIEDHHFASGNQETDSIRSPSGGIQMMIPGLAEKLAQRRQKNKDFSESSEESTFAGNSVVGSPSNSSHQEGGVSFDQPTQLSQLTHKHRIKGPAGRRPPTRHEVTSQ